MPMPCHHYQQEKVAHYHELGLKPVLNGASKEDPAHLGKLFDAINLDAQDFDPQERISLYDIPNFVQGSLLNIPFGDKHFGIVVLGEILEHCKWESALRILQEARRVLKNDGRVVVTVPLDDRPKEIQHPPHLLIEWEGGITSWHQQVWDDGLWATLLAQAEFVEIERQPLEYGFCKGFGAVLRKAGQQ
jgi:SAM-dependent methyltransferase